MLVAFCSNGRKAGKGAAADYVQEWCAAQSITCHRDAFAIRMKLLVAATLGWVHETEGLTNDYIAELVAEVDAFKLGGGVRVWVDAPDKTDGVIPIPGRDFIINLAGDSDSSGARGLFGAEFWTNLVLPYNWVPTADCTVITDLRFPVEANRVTESGGVVIEIQRDNAEGGRSEALLDPLYIDATIENNDSLDQLRERVFTMMDGLAAGR